MNSPLKVIDLFAGPGGLGEGFSSILNEGKKVFDIAVSIEKEKSAHKTLLLRSFFRQFETGDAPREYYQYLEGKLGNDPEDQLYKIPKYRKHIDNARKEARCLELGEMNRDILSAIRESVGRSECIVIGGPPCQAYSLVGRSRNAGKHDYIPEKDERNYLYFEYLKVIAKFQPQVFVMENVKGLLSAKVENKSIFKDIKLQLAHPCRTARQRPEPGRKSHEYRIVSMAVPDNNSELIPSDFIIQSEHYGVPQMRHRVILLGIREDIASRWNSSYILRRAQPPTLGEVIGDLPHLRSGLSKQPDTFENWITAIQSTESLLPILQANGLDKLSKELGKVIRSKQLFSSSRGGTFGIPVESKMSPTLNRKLTEWYKDKRLNAICNHESKSHMIEDLYRYLFCSTWPLYMKNGNDPSLYPKPKDYPIELKPKHANFDSGKFANRFRAQTEFRPASTITSHIAKDGHYFIHYDPLQCRSLTVREAARVQTFPDNYFFVGTRTDQYTQVGNAVPPFLASQIAYSVASLLGRN